ncbi:uncharacterized protein A1O9_10922 [Exophiala aquamarina CBS 119918]|uniref:DNA-directed RNA polymerase n=1 Tax=Exophiala aquamarina CBS 119918 TaxID=1182545 RepID=A0A072NYR3_9EURO|nr:uncharacterized protein A1O9_10922 [Exophiala aquamarina CBS 119918]KEF53014.1 hypothetical protein A1O9_10922 [Exophiala aquamarina CBS 119918]
MVQFPLPTLLVYCFFTVLPICTHAHMQMSSPYPLRSPLDPDISYTLKDYDMTSPLFPDGSNFVCKQYQHDDSSYSIKATYVAGGTYQMSVAGTANHDGGSCQLSLSYDNGVTFKVIKSIIGGCPLSNTYSFTIPSTAPASSTVLFSWSWFNIVGNREMYQNCARVKIVAGPNQRLIRRNRAKRQSVPLQNLPDMFACNVGNGCTTIERREVIFPDPGSDVSYGQDAITPDPGPGFEINGASATATTGTSSGMTTASSPTTAPPFLFGNSSTSMTPPSSSGSMLTLTDSLTSTINHDDLLTTSTAAATTTTTSSSAISTATTLSTVAVASPTSSPSTPTSSTPSTPSSSSTALPVSCIPGTFTCNSPSTFSQCVVTSATSTTFVYMGSVAAGMQCVNGQFSRENDGACTPSGNIFCDGPNAFFMCDQGGLISMGPVAPGTQCQNGEIVVAGSS